MLSGIWVAILVRNFLGATARWQPRTRPSSAAGGPHAPRSTLAVIPRETPDFLARALVVGSCASRVERITSAKRTLVGSRRSVKSSISTQRVEKRKMSQ